MYISIIRTFCTCVHTYVLHSEHQGDLGFSSFGLTLTTLEEVFMKVGTTQTQTQTGSKDTELQEVLQSDESERGIAYQPLQNHRESHMIMNNRMY